MAWLDEHLTFRRSEAARQACRDWVGALRRKPLAFIAEIKFRAPSRGDLRVTRDLEHLARSYAEAGADSLSVLVDERHFSGHWDHLARVRSSCGLPLLAKGFFTDPVDLARARAHGADAVLLIARVLDVHERRRLVDVAHGLGMAVLLEVHEASDLASSEGLDVDAIGVNHRDLRTLDLDRERTRDLAPLLPVGPLRIAASGLSSRADVERMRALGYDAVLVGSALMQEDDPAAALRRLKGGAS